MSAPAWRHYETSEPIRVGDIVKLDEHAFGTCIVTRINARVGYGSMYHCERPHMSVDHQGITSMMIERFEIREDSLRRMQVAVTGHSLEIDNRCRE